MPITKLSASEAIEQVKSNPNGRWPKRGELNRLSPMAQPAFTPGFTLPKGGTIFTIGSCFARNVERALKDRGFRLPALDVLAKDPEFASVGSRVLNNYGAPSICNEIKWAFEDDTDEEACFYQMGNGWVDLHLQNTMRPAELDVVRLRRDAIRTAYRSIAECDAVIITLGLSEVWFDTQTGYYLNMAPRRAMLRADPDRFELHVMSFEETINNLREAVDLIREKGRPDVRIVLTVSPVPLTATYRETDVMIANTYSKSVLRTAAEEIVQTYDCVDYFPSFESITLSERSHAYLDDEIHVSQEIIDLNIGRMVKAYTGDDSTLTLQEALFQLDTFRSRPKLGFDALSQNTELCSDPRIAAVLTECATSVGRFDVAELTLTLSEDPSGMLAAQLHLVQDRPAEALSALKSKPDDSRMSGRYYGLRVRARAEIGHYDDAVAAAEEWAAITPNSPVPYKVLARVLNDQNDPRAATWYARAVSVSGGAPKLTLDLVDVLIKHGQMAEARARLDAIVGPSDQDRRRMTRHLHLLDAVA